jgi:hypothetical protein
MPSAWQARAERIVEERQMVATDATILPAASVEHGRREVEQISSFMIG